MSDSQSTNGAKSSRGRSRLIVSGVGILAAMSLALYQWVPDFWSRSTGATSRSDAATSVLSEHELHSNPKGRQVTQQQPTNRLAEETSPYLLQHAHNPVNWYPWGPEAFARAKNEGKLIFLSVGYSTCFWCHVMERESFENEEIAKILNEHYVAIKVDREERPDIDEQYMLASQLLTGRGGWPNSVWLTPDGKPWMAGTYFPRKQFKETLLKLVELWKSRREDVQAQAERLSTAIRQAGAVHASDGKLALNQELVDRATSEVRQAFDAKHGGFGTAPKFPPHDRLLLLAHEYRQSRDVALLKILTATLDAMAQGGIRDHLAGGFHRYSTDERWLLPHFEKMLYDNAQLLRAYTDGYLLTKNETYREVARDIASWVSREMTDPGGAFYSAIDAESEQEEGKFYVWSYDEIERTFGKQRGGLFAKVYGVEQDGNYIDQVTGQRPGTNVLYLPQPLAEIAQERGLDTATFERELDGMRQKLLATRTKRIHPHLDDKILSSWNGLMIGSLSYAGQHLQNPSYINAASRAAQFVLSSMTKDGQLLRTYRAGRARLPGYLDDYAYFTAGLLDLYEATQDRQWLDRATQLADAMINRFQDSEHGGFFFTSLEHEDLLMRSKNILGGGNVPSGNGVAVAVLLRLGQVTGREEYRRAANGTLQAFSELMWRQPAAAETLVLATALSLSTSEPNADQNSASSDTGRPSQTGGSGGKNRHVEGPVTMEAFASRHAVTPGQRFHVAVVIDTAAPWHLYGPNPDVEFVTSTEVDLQPHPAFQIGDVVLPPARRALDPTLGQTVATYEGRVSFLVPVTVRDEVSLDPVILTIDIRAQPCDNDRCLAPISAKLKLPIVIQGRAAEENALHPDIFKPLGIDK